MTAEQLRTIAAKLDQGTPLTYGESLLTQELLRRTAHQLDSDYVDRYIQPSDIVEHYTDEHNRVIYLFVKYSGFDKNWPERYVARDGNGYKFVCQRAMPTDVVGNFAGYAMYVRI